MKKQILIIFVAFCSINLSFQAETVDDSNVTVDTFIFEQQKATALSGEYGIDNPYVVVDPYGKSPLTAYVGFSSSQPLAVTMVVHDKYDENDSFVYNFGQDVMQTDYFIPVLGLYADHLNQVTLNYEFEDGTTSSIDLQIQTASLPLNIGTIDITYDNKLENTGNNLYFDSIFSGYTTGIDSNGDVRWFNSANDIYGSRFFEVLDDGRLITQNYDQDQYIIYDYNGRIYDYYTTDFRIEHDIQVLEDNHILVNSQDPIPVNPTEIYTIEDQLSVFDITNWSEDYTLDYKLMFDETRKPQPSQLPANEYESDWFHANSSVYLPETNEYLTSSRQQNIIVSTDADFVQVQGVEDTSAINWILGSPQTWEEEEVYSKFLTPVDSFGNELYDLTSKYDIELANSEFFSWAQHSIVPVEFDEDINTIEFYVFDDGNYSSYDPEYWISPNNNTSRMVLYRVNETDMTVEKVDEFGTELGNEYYSTFVGNVEYHEDTDSIMISFGGTNMDQNLGVNVGIPVEAPMEEYPDYDYNANNQYILEKTRIIEIDRETHEILYGFDHYNADAMGIIQNFTYKTKYIPLDAQYINT